MAGGRTGGCLEILQGSRNLGKFPKAPNPTELSVARFAHDKTAPSQAVARDDAHLGRDGSISEDTNRLDAIFESEHVIAVQVGALRNVLPGDDLVLARRN